MKEEKCPDCDTDYAPNGLCPCCDWEDFDEPIDAYDNDTNNKLALWRRYE